MREACFGRGRSSEFYKQRYRRIAVLHCTAGDDPKVFEAKIQIVVIFTWVLSFVV